MAAHPFSTTPPRGQQMIGSVSSNDFLLTKHQNWFSREYRKIRLNQYIPPRPVICMLSRLWPGKYGWTCSYSLVRFAHSRQVLTGRPPFFDMTEVAATYSMVNGARPQRQHHQRISGRVWYIIERCWHNLPSERMSVSEVVNLLEIGTGRTASGFRSLSHT